MQSCKLNKETCASGASLPCPGAPGEGVLCVHHFFSSEVQGRREKGELCFIGAREGSSSSPLQGQEGNVNWDRSEEMQGGDGRQLYLLLGIMGSLQKISLVSY